MEAQDSHLFKVTKQIGAQKGSRPIEARSWMLTRKMLETLVHSNSNRNTMFLPKISPEKNKTLVSLPRENKHMFISEPSHFFFFPLNTSPTRQVVLWLCDFDGHTCWLEKSQGNWEFPHLPHMMCFQGRKLNLFCYHQRVSWRLLSNISFVLLYANTFSLNLPLLLHFTFYQTFKLARSVQNPHVK